VDELVIEYLADHEELAPVLAEWHHGDEGDRTPLDFWIRAHEAEARGRTVPTAWVAFAEDVPVGCVSLIRSNMDTHPELTPWLAALFVVPERRWQGIGTALTSRCERAAAELGYRDLYLYTERAADFYGALGWQRRSMEEYEGESVTVMEKRLMATP
jgi:GNAT superfamily N-acetyltransferase